MPSRFARASVGQWGSDRVRAADFGEFLHAVHGHQPFPWQQRLAERVVVEGTWPELIAVPTAAGKTAVIDVAVFALACSAGSTVSHRAARRIFFVIDRRIVVDSVFERAVRLATALNKAREGIVREVADRLLSLGGEVPLHVAALRGGMFLDHGWARSPVQPLVCVSTVDQVGSRLLFRGYGMATGPTNMLPIHAALVGNDALIILDEAHLSRPFADVLAAIGRYRTWAECPIATPWTVVRMTATPEPDAADVLSEGREDHTHPVLGPRLQARKPATLLETRTETIGRTDPSERRRSVENENRRRLVEEICREALSIRDRDAGARVVGIVVNRVATARAVFEGLRSAQDVECVLLMGPVRPYDRDRTLEAYLPRIRAGRERSPDDLPLNVVATQSIEVGADIDLDALVTECASFDALRQRFGRLDRLGQRGESPGVIVVRRDQVARGAEPDPVYGASLRATWDWLRDRARGSWRGRRSADLAVDIGISSLSPLPAGDELAALTPQSSRAPIMLPAHLDLWVQTSPIPLPDPDPVVFLHAPASEPPDVSVVWRADLSPGEPESWADIVALVPPSSIEAMAIPAYAARNWLAGRPEANISDVEGASPVQGQEEADGRRSLRWQGPRSEDTRPIRPAEVRPGDTIIVPASYGGADRFGWKPDSTEPVPDVAEAVALRYRGRPVIRLHPSILPSLLPGADEETLETVRRALTDVMAALEDGTSGRPEQAVLEVLAAAEGVEDWLREAATALMEGPIMGRIPYPDGRGIVVVGARRRTPSFAGLEDVLTDEDDTTTFISHPVTLAAHSEGVSQNARGFAIACGIPRALAEDLALAGRFHDSGKADPRFQFMLHGGDEVAAAVADRPLAKSGMDTRDREGFRHAFERSGLPRGYRHEATSLALLGATRQALEGAEDAELVLHLVASHHGAARPFLPAVPDEALEVALRLGDQEMRATTAHRLGRLDSGVADRFWRLVQKYGWYGLAYLESILRLADHRRSDVEAGRGGEAV